MSEEQPNDMNEESGNDTIMPPTGEILSTERKRQGKSIEIIAQITRIPTRHLINLENNAFEKLPARTYTIGFAKRYAKALGLSQAEMSEQIKAELNTQGYAAYNPHFTETYDLDETHVPPKTLAWAAAGLASLLIIAFLIWRAVYNHSPEVDLYAAPTLAPDSTQSAPGEEENALAKEGDNAPSSSETPTGDSPVLITATDDVWLRIYEAGGNRIVERIFKTGESYEVPLDANDPMILTGRPDALDISIGGQAAPPLSDKKHTIRDVKISAKALLSRDPQETL